MAWRIGIDTGGTFTDVCLYDGESQMVTVAKVASTPDDPSRAVLEGVRSILGNQPSEPTIELDLAGVSYFAHGTTVATNALLQQRGTRCGLITTRGFRDLLELARQKRPSLYDFGAQKPVTLVPRDRRHEVSERLSYDGNVIAAPSEHEIRDVVVSLRERGVEAIAVCFLYSFLEHSHEDLVRRVVEEELPDAFVSVSHEVLPEFREYERLSTTVINAFIGPVMKRYLTRLHDGLAPTGLRVEPKVTQSSGSVMTFDRAGDMPVRTLLSGPSTGVVGAAKIAAQLGLTDVITFDMGGTSSDVALVRDSHPTSATGMMLEGRPVQTPALDINTVGAGGGSIAWVDSGGHLKVGPHSAGAAPGPACYVRGNDEPTVTDANVVLGILNQSALLGGSMPIDASRSYRSVERLGQRLGLSTVECAQGIVSIVTANMARAIRVISVQRGYDPADYTLVAFGGAGPLHSARLAAELHIPRTLVPQTPGAMSAVGMLMTELRTDYTLTEIVLCCDGNLGRVAAIIAELEARAGRWFTQEATSGEATTLRRVIDVRYKGQNYELGVEAPSGAVDREWRAAVAKAFHVVHAQRYGYDAQDSDIELVTFRIEATVKVPQATLPRHTTEGNSLPATPAASRQVYLPELEDRIDCLVYRRSELYAGQRIAGPCIIEQYDSTTLVLPDQAVTVSPTLALVTEPIGD